MKIPNSTKKTRYYVAKSKTQAFSSWPTFLAALESYKQLKAEKPKQKIIGIYEISKCATIFYDKKLSILK